jgi:hypothetical protein
VDLNINNTVSGILVDLFRKAVNQTGNNLSNIDGAKIRPNTFFDLRIYLECP